MTACALQRGDLMLLDYRTLHAGLPNASGQPRPIVYMVYARPWFFDHGNHVTRIPLDMPLERFSELPESVRPLLVRAFSYATRMRWNEAGAPPQRVPQAPAQPVAPPAANVAPPAANSAPSSGQVGRNDPCPCGSGGKYKHCHGRLA